MAELKVTEVIDRYEHIWVNVSKIPDQPKAFMVVSDENTKNIKPGDSIRFYRESQISWTPKGRQSGVILSRVDNLLHPRPELTAQTLLQKERQVLLDQIKGLECELRTESDKYEHEIKEMKKSHRSTINNMSSSRVNCRIYATVVSVIAFVSTYLHFS